MGAHPLAAVARGFAAGIVGTGCMTAWQTLSAKLQDSGEESGGEPSEPPEDPWEEASAPAKVAKRIGEGVLHKSVPADLIPLLTNVMHWGYGTGWGASMGWSREDTRRTMRSEGEGALFGAGVCDLVHSRNLSHGSLRAALDLRAQGARAGPLPPPRLRGRRRCGIPRAGPTLMPARWTRR